MANTFELIASSTVGSGGASSIDFSSIPSTYTDLCLKLSGRAASVNAFYNFLITFNNSGGTAYTTKLLYGNGSSAAYASQTGVASVTYGFLPGAGATANSFGNAEIYIPNYAGSNNKSLSIDQVEETNTSLAYAGFIASLWADTSAINRITITTDAGGNLVQYSTAYLYGVKNA